MSTCADVLTVSRAHSDVTAGDESNVLETVQVEYSEMPGTAQPDLEVVIPTFNEERRIAATLSAAVSYLAEQSWMSTVTVVDNGCSDRTTELVDRVSVPEVPIRVIGCTRRGKGAAVRRGMLAARARYVGFCDADLSTPISTIGSAMALLSRGAPVVIGSRRCQGAAYLTEQSLLRRAGGMTFRSIARSVVPGIADPQCGFKFFRTDVARRLFASATTDGFAFDVEIIGLAHAVGIPIAELPVEWSDDNRSSFRPFSDGQASFRELLQLRARFAPDDALRLLAAGNLGEAGSVLS